MNYEDTPLLAELYDRVPVYQKRPDVDFYVKACLEHGQKILELGCGTGRVLMRLAEVGADITGLDISDHMLSVCRGKLERKEKNIQNRVRLIRGDMTDFILDETFDVVIIPFRAFQHLLTVPDQLACLDSVKRHLVEEGKLIFDIFQVDLDRLNNPRYLEETEDFPEYELPDGRRLRRTSRIAAFHLAGQYNDVELIYYLTGRDGASERIVHAFPFRYFFRYEMEHLLERGGFKIVNLFGDFDKSPLTDSSPEMIFIAEKNRIS